MGLVPGVEYAYLPGERRVTYRARDTTERRVRWLLHECGHVLIEQSMRRRLRRKFILGYHHPRQGRGRPRASAADILHEEIEAWHRGLGLARRLGVKVDLDAYWRDYGVAIHSYARGFVRRKL